MRLRVRVVTLSGDFDPTVEVVSPTGVTRCSGLRTPTPPACSTPPASTRCYVRGDGSGEYAISLGTLNAPGNCPDGRVRHHGALQQHLRRQLRLLPLRRRRRRPDPRARARGGLDAPPAVGDPASGRDDAVRVRFPPRQTCTTDTAGRHAVLIRDGGAGTGHGVVLGRPAAAERAGRVRDGRVRPVGDARRARVRRDALLRVPGRRR